MIVQQTYSFEDEIREKYPFYMSITQAYECLGVCGETFRKWRNKGTFSLKKSSNGKFLRDGIIQWMLNDAGLLNVEEDELSIEDTIIASMGSNG